ncbi:DDE-type integrase/transposase/recombinase [Pseudomonas fluorescens]|uniref:Transposase family protein n=1 Tax=Pseudomonas fluorescens TaxID=294 RepID=A0A944DKQ0_PSEFL|nr:DDE-type integrase/transposase/recombinase [Pseudomonas fluorescens]MBT2294524.1 transposase family protein [Pseudomonas fluorescens]MBT2306820.1 transposase family protein [Pseudomonas fluorescens]MBT2316270.1 transposase family protein [Pseudomonas fluorescens]MBT2331607.1 transposase family protein [Pseudomonas fluorescens]MBT2342775.1 transposase family protein [Pseudomonas fluorescens]
MNPVQIQQLAQIAQRAENAPHGQRTAVYQAGAAELGVSVQTLQRKLKEIRVTKPRKRRSDSGCSALPIEEARMISAVLLESIRANNKQLSTIERAVERLRSNNLIVAGRVDEQTGLFRPLTGGAISRALRAYKLHPEQLLHDAPAVSLASKHPNHVWQVDASISTQFYLADDGARAMNKAEFYDGKPGNLKKIERQRLWRYVITDHTSGTLYVEYVLGAESAENLCNVLINAMQKRGESDPFHGVPWVLMTDPGAAMTSGIFRNLCRAMSIDLIINQVGNARAKGQVEQAHNIVEREFESALKFQAAESLEQINAWAGKWMRYFNATSIHTRTRCTRYGVWQMIRQEQLRLAPGVEVCRELAVSTPEYRKVSNLLRVSFRGAQFDVSSVPSVMVGEKLLITRNCWRDKDTAIAVLVGEDGRENYHIIERIGVDEFGFAETSATIGETYKRHAETPAQLSRKVLEQIATGTTNQADAEAARKAKAVPFGGLIDPHKHVTDTVLPAYMPRRGTSLNVKAPTVEVAPLSHVEAAKLLRPRLGNLWTAETFGWLQQRYPEGVPEEQLDAVEAELKRPVEVMRKPFSLVLAAVGGE